MGIACRYRYLFCESKTDKNGTSTLEKKQESKIPYFSGPTTPLQFLIKFKSRVLLLRFLRYRSSFIAWALESQGIAITKDHGLRLRVEALNPLLCCLILAM